MLAELVAQHGPRKWSFIASMLGNRIGKQCRERYRRAGTRLYPSAHNASRTAPWAAPQTPRAGTRAARQVA